LIVALAVFLLSTVAVQVLGLPVQAASVPPEVILPPSIDFTPPMSLDSSSPLPTPEPTITNPTAPTEIPALVLPTPIPTTPPADQPGDQPASQPTDRPSYTVQEGDTLAAIARTHQVFVQDLAAANGLTDPDLLYVGQTLIVPDNSSIDPTTSIITITEEPSTPNPTEVPAEPTPVPGPASPETIKEERWIDVDLSEQRLTAYESSAPVHSFLVSTGLPATPTPVGQFRIWIKLRYDDMAGADYYIEDVPFVMYFHEGYGLHGVTWHGNFGHPMSHGCINLPTEEAEWLFGFAEVGTLVNIHE
jgi:lipoprotein-anchoring transpeptidase ErfK/SrfK